MSRLAAVVADGVSGRLEWHRPGPSAAFGRRNALAPGFACAVETARARGFEPFVRPVCGRLAAYHDGALVLDLLLRWDDPRAGTTKFVGSGQRLVRNAVLLTAVVVSDAEPLREVMSSAYTDLGLSIDRRTVGSVSDEVPGVTRSDVEGVLGEVLAESLPSTVPTS